MWVEAGEPADTFWRQTQRSFANTLVGVARRNTRQAWMVAALSAAASVGKLKPLDDYLPSDPAGEFRTANAKLLHGFRVLQSRGVNVTIERLH